MEGKVRSNSTGKWNQVEGQRMTLQEGTPGAQYVVTGIDLPLELERRLEALGLLEGSRVLVLEKKRRGAVIVKVRGTRFALGDGIVRHVTVRE